MKKSDIIKFKFSSGMLLLPVDRDTHKYFYRLQSNVFDITSLFETNHVPQLHMAAALAVRETVKTAETAR